VYLDRKTRNYSGTGGRGNGFAEKHLFFGKTAEIFTVSACFLYGNELSVIHGTMAPVPFCHSDMRKIRMPIRGVPRRSAGDGDRDDIASRCRPISDSFRMLPSVTVGDFSKAASCYAASAGRVGQHRPSRRASDPFNYILMRHCGAIHPSL
jgi:hypothetical protein